MVQKPLAGTLGFGRTPILKTPDGQVIVLVRSLGIFLWRAASPDRLIPVIAPSRRRAEPEPAVKAGPRRGLYGANPPRVLQIAPRGDRLYLLEQNNLHIWALESTSDGSRVQARELASVPVAEGTFGNTALSPDGAVLALADRAESVILFDTARLKVAGLIKPPPREIESFLGALAFSPDSHDLAIGSQQGTIFVWSVDQPARPRLRFRLPGHRGPVSNLVYDAQGQRLASTAFTGIDPLVEVWDLKLIQHELNRLGLED
jgi:WD40 repeat protein